MISLLPTSMAGLAVGMIERRLSLCIKVCCGVQSYTGVSAASKDMQTPAGPGDQTLSHDAAAGAATAATDLALPAS
jgi:hypothetical protein